MKLTSTEFIDFFTHPNHPGRKFATTAATVAIQFSFLFWSTFNAIFYLGCLDSQLLCPKSTIKLPGTKTMFENTTELPLFLLMALIAIIALPKTFINPKSDWVLILIQFLLLVFSSIYIETAVSTSSYFHLPVGL
jgi:hypothetical protein